MADVTNELLLRSAARLGELAKLNPSAVIFCHELALCMKRALVAHPKEMREAIESRDSAEEKRA